MEWLGKDPGLLLTGRAFLLLTFCINHMLSGLSTFGYHLLNLLIHISTAFLIYIFITDNVDNQYCGYSQGGLFAALLFVLHPLNTESVTYISSRSSELATFFVLASIILFRRSTKREGLVLSLYVLSIICFILGLSTKQSAIVTPLLLLLVDSYFVSPGGESFSKRLRYHIPFWGIVAVGSYAYIGLITHADAPDRAWKTHIFTELRAVAEYIRLMVIPHGLAIDHYFPSSESLDSRVVASAAIISSLLIFAFAIRKRRPILSFSIFWIFINLLPFLAVRLNDYIAERWAYAAVIGFTLTVSELFGLFHGRFKRLSALAAALLLLPFGWFTYARNEAYATPVSLWADAAVKAPDSIKPHVNLCGSYLEMMMIDKAVESCEKAVALGSGHAETRVNLASAYFAKGDYETSGRILLELKNDAALEVYHYNLGNTYKIKGEFRKAISEYEDALRIQPRSPASLASIGLSYKGLGEREKAEKYFRAAIAGIPQSGDDFIMLAVSYSNIGDNEKGAESLRSAILSEPLNLRIRNIIAEIYMSNKNFDEAYRHYSIMADISPGLPIAYKGMGLALAAKGDTFKAGRYFKKALELLTADSPDREEIIRAMNGAR